MNTNFSCLRCPSNGDPLELEENYLVSKNGQTYPVVDGIPRFVNNDNYSQSFGLQWNKFRLTQLDSYSGFTLSEDRLRRCLGGDLEILNGKKVLEAGSGAGRFTEVLLKHKAILHSFDYSNAVEANALNHSNSKNLILVQADIYHMPFPKKSYDIVVCLGVLQHLPSPEDGIRCLWEMVTPGGMLVFDHYPFKWKIVLPPPIGESLGLYRIIILSLPLSLRFRAVEFLVRAWFPIHWLLRDSKISQKILRRLSPLLFYYHDFDLHGKEQYYEWSLMDTHDGLTDIYKHRRTLQQIRNAVTKLANCRFFSVKPGGNGFEVIAQKSN